MTQTQAGTSPDASLSRLATAAAGARILMGAVFVVAGAAKSFQPVIFYWEAISYVELLNVGREAWDPIGRVALALPPLEVLVGLALILGWRPRLALPAATLMMVLFIALTGYAWHQAAEIDCGCFGTLVERSPGQALVEDAVMLVLLLSAWRWGSRRWSAAPWPWTARLVPLGAVVALAVLLLRFAPESGRIASSDLKPGVRLIGLELKGLSEELDLGAGKLLVEVFSPRCPHCMRAVPVLNSWVDTPGMPTIVALSSFPPDSPQLIDFVQKFRPRYKIASISSSDWKRLTWQHGWPRLAYLEDGIIRRVWEHDEMPSAKQLLQLTGEGQT